MTLYFNLAKRFAMAHAPSAVRERLLPLKLTVASTFRCNHQCRICSIWRVYREHPDRLKSELNVDDYARVFSELKSSLLFLDWGGGEPFLRPDMRELLACAATTCPKLSSFVITTNGLLTERIDAWVAELAERHKRHHFAIGVSLDGDEGTHDHIRGKPGAFLAATETIRRLKAMSTRLANVEVKISYTLCSLNTGRFPEFHRQVLAPLGLGVGDVGFNLEHVGNLFQTTGFQQRTVGEIGTDEFRHKVGEDIAWALARIKAERLSRLKRLKSFYRGFFLERIPEYLEHPDRMVIPCRAVRNSLYLDPYGTLHPCVVWGRPLGNCRDGVESVLSSDTAVQARSLIDKERCPICWNACEAIPSLLTSWRLAGCVMRSVVS